MTECELLAKCKFFYDNLKNMPAASETIKKFYCRWHFSKCARYKIATVLGRKEIPPDLFPGDFGRAGEILARENNNRIT